MTTISAAKANPRVHEVGITQSLLAIAEEHARKAGARRITALSVEVGGLAGVVPEALEFCFAACAAGTLADGATLNIVRIPGKGRCRDCRTELDLDPYSVSCPRCQGFDLERLQGDELRLIEVEID